MATLISDELRWTARQIITSCGYSSATLSGLAPDKRHLDRGGFHCSVLDLRAYGNSNDYSNTRANDRDFNVEHGAAFDVSMSPKDMIVAFRRVHTVWADRSDPRRKFINAVNGWDGSGDAVRLDFDTGTSKRASADHKWHNHGEIHRRFVRDQQAARAVVSMYKGESKTAWLAREDPNAQEDDMPITDTEWKRLEAMFAAVAPQKVWEHDIGKATGGQSLRAHGALVTANARAGSAANQQLPAIASLISQLGTQMSPAQLAAALAPPLADAVVAKLPADSDDITPDEIKQAILAAARDLLT